MKLNVYKSLIIIIIGVLTSCGSSNLKSGNMEAEHIQNVLQDGNFSIVNTWAAPLAGNRINLIGNPNFIRFNNDQVDLFLPYFGVRHMGGGYNGEGGIEYKGVAKDLQITETGNKGEHLIKFNGEQNSEDLNFIIRVFKNGNTNTSVSSSERQSISYTGEIRETSDSME